MVCMRRGGVTYGGGCVVIDDARDGSGHDDDHDYFYDNDNDYDFDDQMMTMVTSSHGALHTTVSLPPCRCLALQLRDADNLSPVQGAVSRPTLLAVAAWFPARDRGTVRLIDNTVLLEEESKA